jgi:[FeFe] hydrogenase H-cluster maturation GTPase HydF
MFMSLSATPVSARPHIAFFGMRNAGKSSVMNAVTGQEASIVSDYKGTTTDPVVKAMELLPMGPVAFIDTPGFDDDGALGESRVRKARQILAKADLAVLVVDAALGMAKLDSELIRAFSESGIPYIICHNKADLLETHPNPRENEIYVSAKTGWGIFELKEKIAAAKLTDDIARPLTADLIKPGDAAVLVVPIDSAAPKGRLILPQQQVARDTLEAGGFACITKEDGLARLLESLNVKPRIVVTDSQAFGVVSKITPDDVALTSFSMLFARRAGLLAQAAEGAKKLEDITDESRILIAEGCTHHRQCDDIGTVKLPRWIRAHTGKNPRFEFVSGADFPEDVSGYDLVVHCGGCMINLREMKRRARLSAAAAFTNYGVLIAYMTGILERAAAPFGGME